MRGRGLKRRGLLHFASLQVAPHAGAWIETCDHIPVFNLNAVAPHAGAWIETENRFSTMIILSTSPPMRGRGLKPLLNPLSFFNIQSPPMRGRGLKHN